MMEVEYRREMNRNYMIIRPPITGNEKYAIRMLSGNQIQGLLAFQDKMVDGNVKYYYDITSKQPLNRILEHRHMSGDELRALVSELLYTLKQMERFFLDEGQLCFQPEYIYVEPNPFKVSFCLIPGQKKEFAEELCELSQYLLDHVNQSDGGAVVLAFSIFKECRKLNFGIEDIERCLRQQEISRSEFIETLVSDDHVPYREQNIYGETKRENREHVENNKSLDSEMPLKTRTHIERQNEKRDENFKDKTNMNLKATKVFIIVLAALMVGIPSVLFLMDGLSGIYLWRWMLLAGEILSAFLIIFLCLNQKEKTDLKPEWDERNLTDDFDEEPWEVFFREEKEENKGTFSNMDRYFEEHYEKERDQEEDDFQTVLLCSRPIYKECRKLVPMNGGSEIPVGYFPFLIGKSKDLTDYCLNKSGVSRLHVKIEETVDGYSVTDLNSTNGTMINGTLLEANETAPLHLGDELTIAAERYYFR